MNGLYVRAAICMIEANSLATSDAILSADMLHVSAGRRGAASMRAPSADTHGIDPIAPVMSASASSGVRYQRTVNGVGAAPARPVIAFRNASDPDSVSARKNTHPIMTTTS